jgi:hypothetical protein
LLNEEEYLNQEVYDTLDQKLTDDQFISYAILNNKKIDEGFVQDDDEVNTNSTDKESYEGTPQGGQTFINATAN